MAMKDKAAKKKLCAAAMRMHQQGKALSDNEELINKLDDEFTEVKGRLDRLNAALAKGEDFRKKVGEDQYDLLCKQQLAMTSYRNILAIRIELLRHPAEA